MKRALALLFLATTAGSVHAGEVKIGMDPFGKYPKKCHVAVFQGPREAAVAYQDRQKKRFEDVDQAVVDRLTREVSVSVLMAAPPERTSCTLGSGKPEKIVLAANGEPVLSIPLELEELVLKNLAGAEFAAFNGYATLPLADVEAFAGRELEFHLIFANGTYKDKWKKDYVAKLLK